MATKTPQKTALPKKRPLNQRFVGVIFSCCKVYGRIYLPNNRPVVYGFCPGCGGRMEIHQSPNGSQNRFFTAN